MIHLFGEIIRLVEHILNSYKLKKVIVILHTTAIFLNIEDLRINQLQKVKVNHHLFQLGIKSNML